MDATAATTAAPTVERSRADQRMRRLLLLPEGGPKVSIFEAQKAFSKSIAISATRCLVTYVALPLMAPIIDLTGAVGGILGLVLSAISMTAIFFAARRFFAADHKYRWYYAGVGAAIYVLLIVGIIADIRHLLS